MSFELKQKLRAWRSEMAMIEGVEPYRIFSNIALDELVEKLPRTKEEFLCVKGFKEKKFARYGKEILSIINENHPLAPSTGGGTEHLISSSQGGENLYAGKESVEEVFSVSEYLDALNGAVRGLHARIHGEVSSADVRGSYLFFSIKDSEDDAMVTCFMWRNDFDLCGINLEEGLEVIVSGFPEVYKPSGRLSFRSQAVELVGEGALKKAYDALKEKLEQEGVFDEERKRPLVEFPHKIGLITSREGAVIHDFLNNLGRFGFRVQFHNSRVEGQLAVANLLEAVEYFHDKDIDALVIIRGGGSWESLQAFNNESLVRAVVNFPQPVLCGVGHHEDVTLVALAADSASSTPTAVTKLLNQSWESALSELHLSQESIMGKFRESLYIAHRNIELPANFLHDSFESMKQRIVNVFRQCDLWVERLRLSIQQSRKSTKTLSGDMFAYQRRLLSDAKNLLHAQEKMIKFYDPHRQLRMGYSLLYKDGKLVRSVQNVSPDDEIVTRLEDGDIVSRVIQK